MKTLDRYIQGLFLKNLATILLALLSLYGIVEFIEKVDDFIEHQAALVYYALFPIYNLPLMISNTLPMAVLLSAFVTIGGLSRSNQLTALIGGGISLTRISRQIFIAGFVLSLLLMLCNLWLTPMGIRETEYIKNVHLSKQVAQDSPLPADLYFRNRDRIVHVKRSFPQHGELLDITILRINDAFRPLSRLHAASGRYLADGLWRLDEVKIWEFSEDGKAVANFQEQKTQQLDLQKSPEEMTQLWNVPEEMTQTELTRVISRMQKDGHDPLRYQVESHLRLSKSFIPVIMVLLGMPFALQRGRRASFASGIVVSLGVFSVYFTLYAVFAALGGSGVLPPVVAAWSANILMILTGTWLFLRAQD